jgi:hypothetical protein
MPVFLRMSSAFPCRSTLADIRRPRALPYDGICQGLSRNPVPGKRRLPLIADANAYDPRSVNIFRQPGYHIDYILIDLDRVMGHPAFFINDLLMGLIRPLDQASALIEQQRFRTLGTLVDADYIFLRHPLTPSLSRSSLQPGI